LAGFGGRFSGAGRRGLRFAAALELLEVFQGLEIAVRETRLIARELGEGIGAGGIAGCHGADHVELGLFGIAGQLVGVGFVVAAGVVEIFGEHAGLDLRDAAHAPFGVGELAEQGPLHSGSGLELVF
jgi:hypothetical protein